MAMHSLLLSAEGAREGEREKSTDIVQVISNITLLDPAAGVCFLMRNMPCHHPLQQEEEEKHVK